MTKIILSVVYIVILFLTNWFPISRDAAFLGTVLWMVYIGLSKNLEDINRDKHVEQYPIIKKRL